MASLGKEEEGAYKGSRRNFSFVWLIGIRPGRVRYQSPRGKRGGKILEEALLGVLGGIKAKVLVMSVSSCAYS